MTTDLFGLCEDFDTFFAFDFSFIIVLLLLFGLVFNSSEACSLATTAFIWAQPKRKQRWPPKSSISHYFSHILPSTCEPKIQSISLWIAESPSKLFNDQADLWLVLFWPTLPLHIYVTTVLFCNNKVLLYYRIEHLLMANLCNVRVGEAK